MNEQEQTYFPHLGDLLDQEITPTSAAFLIEIRRIADALEVLAGTKMSTTCDEANPENGEVCVLDVSHVGYHQPGNGRKPWLDS